MKWSCRPFTKRERDELQFLYDEWAHPYFISRQEFIRIMEGTGQLDKCHTEDWMRETLPSWRQQFWRGIVDPLPWLTRPHLWWKCFRDAVTLERMHRAFESGLMEYGVLLAGFVQDDDPCDSPVKTACSSSRHVDCRRVVSTASLSSRLYSHAVLVQA